MPSTQLFPEIQDATQVGGVFTSPVYLPVGVEGSATSGADATAGQPYSVDRPSQAADLFNADSTLYALVVALLSRGVAPVTAVASKIGSGVNLDDRKAAWANLESMREVRIRMTDSLVEADIAGASSFTCCGCIICTTILFICGIGSVYYFTSEHNCTAQMASGHPDD